MIDNRFTLINSS